MHRLSRPCRDRLVFEHAIADERVGTLLNFVDLTRFRPRPGPLPARPGRALLFADRATPELVATVRAACGHAGITLDAVGAGLGNACVAPERILGE